MYEKFHQHRFIVWSLPRSPTHVPTDTSICFRYPSAREYRSLIKQSYCGKIKNKGRHRPVCRRLTWCAAPWPAGINKVPVRRASRARHWVTRYSAYTTGFSDLCLRQRDSFFLTSPTHRTYLPEVLVQVSYIRHPWISWTQLLVEVLVR